MITNKNNLSKREILKEGTKYDIYKVTDVETGKMYSARISTKKIDEYLANEIISLRREINIVPFLNHPTIEKFILFDHNIFKLENHATFLTEYFKKGTLSQVITQNNPYYTNTKRLITIYGIASAMCYLHSQDIVHCDLKPSNIYLDDNLYPKLSGFEVSKRLTDLLPNDQFIIKGTPAYISPEVYLYQGHNKASDVYSFSLIVYEILTNKKPFEDHQEIRELFDEIVTNNKRPSIPEEVPKVYRELLERCWQQNADQRPTFEDIVNELKTKQAFLSDDISESEYRDYIKFVEETETSFETSELVPNIDDLLSGFIFDEMDINEQYKGTYETETNNLNYHLKKIDLSKFKKVKNSLNIRGGSSTITEVKNMETGEVYIQKKSFNSLKRKNDILYFTREVSISLQLCHPCTIKCIGYNIPTSKTKIYGVILYEKCSNISLDRILDQEKKGSHILSETRKLIIIYGIASAMAYLHSCNIIHRDLKIENVCLDDYLNPKIIDFGTSKLEYDHINMIRDLSKSIQNTTTKIIAPELLETREEYEALFTKKSDVYSFAIVLYEIITGVQPFETQSLCHIADQIMKGCRPSFDSPIQECYRNLIERCWSQEPEKRPTFAEIVNELETNPEFITDQIDEEKYHEFINYTKGNNDSSIEQYEEDIELEEKNLSISVSPIDLNQFERQTRIGMGSFGKVYKVKDITTGDIYACKISIDNVNSLKDIQIINLEREITVMSKINHPFIIKFIGYNPQNFKGESRPTIITELIPNGCLKQIIDQERQGLADANWDDTKKLINIYGIASAMSYLHSLNILHRDLKTENIFLDEYLFPKIGDFGLSKELSEETTNTGFENKSGIKGTYAYLDPFAWKTGIYEKPCDVYSFAIIVYEIVTNEVIYKGFNELNLYSYVISGRRPIFKFEIPKCYRELIEKCWSENPYERYTFEEIVELLHTDQDFITDNVDSDEFFKYVDFIDEIIASKKTSNQHVDYDKSLLSKTFNKVSIDLSLGQENDFNDPALIEGFLDINNYERDKIINKNEISKIYEVRNKETGEKYSAKISKIMITRLKRDEVINLSREVNIIAQIRHPSILKFIGYSPTDFNNKKRPVIVSELSKRGTLQELLTRERQQENIPEWDDTKRLILMYGIAAGMSYLHSHNILHRDLTPESIFFDEYFYPKIGNFGLCTRSHTLESMTFQSMSGVKGKPTYSSPEILQMNEYSKAGDVYSYSLIVYEVMTKEVPFGDFKNMNDIFNKIVMKGYRPPINVNIPDQYRKLIEICWSQEANDRPTFEDIVNILKTDKGFITETINVDAYYEYVNYIDSSRSEFYSNKRMVQLDDLIKSKSKIEEDEHVSSESESESANEDENKKTDKNEDEESKDKIIEEMTVESTEISNEKVNEIDETEKYDIDKDMANNEMKKSEENHHIDIEIEGTTLNNQEDEMIKIVESDE